MSTNSLCIGEEIVDDEVRKRIRDQLHSNEQLVWMGQPIPSKIMMQSWHYLFVGGLVISAALYFHLDGLALPGPLIIYAVGLLFLSIPALQYLTGMRTGYALTNKRAMVLIQGLIAQEQYFYTPVDLLYYRKEEYASREGAGSLVFAVVLTETSIGDQSGQTSPATKSTRKYGFIAIDEVHEVERILHETLLKH